MRAVVIAVVVVLALATTHALAGAEVRDPGKGGAYIDGGDPTASATDVGSDGGGEGGVPVAPLVPCHWEVAVADDFAFAVYDADTGEKLHSATGRWLQKVCDGIGIVDVGGRYLIPEGGLVDPIELALHAVRSVRIAPPNIVTSPSRQQGLVVQVPTWLWIEGGWWHAYEATARAGRVWSTVRARPVQARWSFGDGHSITCEGPGRRWSAGAPDSSSGCRYTYQESSAGASGGRFPLRVEVTLRVSWASNVAAGGDLADISRSSTVDVVVGEIQAIGTR